MISIKKILESRQIFEDNIDKRGYDISYDQLDNLYNKWKEAIQKEDAIRFEINRISDKIATEKDSLSSTCIDKCQENPDCIKCLQQKSKNLGDTLQSASEESRNNLQTLNALLLSVPNFLDPEVPNGKSENNNILISTWTSQKSEEFDNKITHDLICNIRTEEGAIVSGSKFLFLEGDLALLNRSMINFMLDCHRDHGYQEIYSPLIVNEESAYGTGQLPNSRDGMFIVTTENELINKSPRRYLIPTAEVSVTNFFRGQVIQSGDLPKRYVCYSECFRNEVSVGKDHHGLIRLHQFPKVELVSITTPDQSAEEHVRELKCAESILQKLELSFRRILLCSGDTGFASQKTYDIEVFMAASNRYVEVSSCSNFGSFQSRRINIKYKEGDKRDYVHTLNGSGLSIGRPMAAIIENYQVKHEDKSVTIKVPNVLIPYCKKEFMRFELKK